jgi:hypothetical protein
MREKISVKGFTLQVPWREEGSIVRVRWKKVPHNDLMRELAGSERERVGEFPPCFFLIVFAVKIFPLF